MPKKRAMITVDSSLWDTVQNELKLQGYPVGSLSLYLCRCVEDLEEYLSCEEVPLIHPSSPIADLEIFRIGLNAAADRFDCDLRDWKIVKDEPEK